MCHIKRGLPLLLAVTLLLFVRAAYAQTQDRSWEWQHWDAVINNINTSANKFHVAETQVIHVTQGSFAGGDRSIDRSRLTSMDNITVTDNGQSLRYMTVNSAADCPTDPG